MSHDRRAVVIRRGLIDAALVAPVAAVLAAVAIPLTLQGAVELSVTSIAMGVALLVVAGRLGLVCLRALRQHGRMLTVAPDHVELAEGVRLPRSRVERVMIRPRALRVGTALALVAAVAPEDLGDVRPAALAPLDVVDRAGQRQTDAASLLVFPPTRPPERDAVDAIGEVLGGTHRIARRHGAAITTRLASQAAHDRLDREGQVVVRRGVAGDLLWYGVVTVVLGALGGVILSAGLDMGSGAAIVLAVGLLLLAAGGVGASTMVVRQRGEVLRLRPGGVQLPDGTSVPYGDLHDVRPARGARYQPEGVRLVLGCDPDEVDATTLAAAGVDVQREGGSRAVDPGRVVLTLPSTAPSAHDVIALLDDRRLAAQATELR